MEWIMAQPMVGALAPLVYIQSQGEKQTMSLKSAKLHLGCGTVIKSGWINHDIFPLPGVDVVHDLREFPWPFEDGQFEEVYMKDVLEHLPDTIRTMEELYRITQPGAKVFIAVPYWNSAPALGDPTHVRFFNEHTFFFFDPDAWQCKERPYYSHARFHIERLGVWFSPLSTLLGPSRFTRDFLIFNPILKKILLILSNFFNNIVDCLELHFRRAS